MPPPRKKQRQSLDATSAVTVSVKQDAVESTPTVNIGAAETDSKDSKPAPPQRTLFIRSLPSTTTTDSLTALFSRSRPIKHATAVLDPTTGKCRGYGFVTFADAEDAVAAKEEFHRFKLNGELGEEPPQPLDEDGNERIAKGIRLRVDLAEQRHRQKTSRFGADGVETTEIVDASATKEKHAEEKKMKRDLEQGSKLIVRNLPWTIKSGEQLGKHFEKYGALKGAVVPRKNGGLLQGFGFVTFKSRKSAEKALKEGSVFEIDGRSVAVDWAVTRDVWKGAPPIEDTEEEDEVAIKTEDEDNGVLSDESGEQSDADMHDEEDDQELSDDAKIDDDEDEDEATKEFEQEDRSGTLFVRNLPFTCTDEELEEAFRSFGAVRYARVVIDQVTERSRGTGFVCFYDVSDADECLRNAPRQTQQKTSENVKPSTTVSVLQDESLDPTGHYTIDGRVLQVTRAVAKSEANRLTKEGAAARFNRDKDKRRLYLLSEGTIGSNSALYERLSPTERQVRETSAKQRRTLIENNPSLNLSFTRLSVRNIPRSITSKDLKQLAREAVVGFATDVKAGKRQRLSKEEVARGGEEMRAAEVERKAKAKGIVKQATIVFEGREGAKVEEKSGAGRSRGYGFIEYHTHRNALMGLRWLNGHLIDYQTLQKVKEPKGKSKEHQKEVLEDRKKRLIVEFAIENAQVVQRRKEKEIKARDRSKAAEKEQEEEKKGKTGGKRKRGDGDGKDGEDAEKPEVDKLANRQRIIQKKRMMRRAKKKGKA